MGILDLLRGVADQADLIPGFDPNKDKRGLISQLLGGGQQMNPSGVPPIVPQGQMAAPGGANPYAQYAKPRGFLKRMVSPNSQDRLHDAGHMAFLETQGKQYSAQQAQALAQQQRTQRTGDASKYGLSGRDALSFINSGKVPDAKVVGAGDSIFANGSLAQANQGVELTTDALGRPIMADLDAQTFGQPNGPAKPMSLASGAQAIDPLSNEVLAHNTAMTDYQAGQLENKRAEIAAEAAENDGPDVSGESTLRKEFLSQNKPFQEVQRAYARVRAVDTSNAAGQMGLIFQYMKMLDPGSTVREGEFATAQNTTGIPGAVLNAYNKARAGEFLNADQVNDFRQQADNLYAAASEGFEHSFQDYRSRSDSYGFDASRTIPDLRNSGGQAVQIESDEEYDQLPTGAQYIGPDGVTRIKP